MANACGRRESTKCCASLYRRWVGGYGVVERGIFGGRTCVVWSMVEMTNEVCEGVKLVMEERVILMGTRNGGISSTDKGQLWVGT